MMPDGVATAVTTPKDVLRKLGVGADGAVYSAGAATFGGVLGILDLGDRTKDMHEMGVGRMQWACELLDEAHTFSNMLGFQWYHQQT